MKVRVELLGIASAVLLFGCMKEDSGEAVNEDDAASVQALSMQEDGSDQDMADATDDTPADSQDCHFASIRKHIVATYDQNGDGKLESSERDALNEDFGGPSKRLVRRHIVRGQRIHWLKHIYDADNSGKLDDSERATLEADLEQRCENRMKQLLAEYDQNADGKLDLDERYDARLAIRKQLEQRWDALVKQYDADNSGSLNGDELVAVREYLRSRVRGEQFGKS